MKTFHCPVFEYCEKLVMMCCQLPKNHARIEDSEVLAWAVSEQRVILTFDRDYGELIYKLGLLPPSGVIYLRYQPLNPIEPAEQLLRLLKVEKLQFEGRFTVVDRSQVRQRLLPEDRST
jgi:predicted nuclease of predicted toxin-antitoxin system